MNSRSLLTMPYQLSRGPITLIDLAVAHRLPADSAPRLVFDRAVGSYDRLAGRLLRDRTLVQRGTERVGRADKLADAATLEQQAAERRSAADEAARAAQQDAADKMDEAHERVEAGVRDARTAERRGKNAAAAKARTARARSKEQADAIAARRVRTTRQRVGAVEQAAEARTDSARRTAKAKLADVSKQRSAASAERSDADRLDRLAATKRQARKRT